MRKDLREIAAGLGLSKEAAENTEEAMRKAYDLGAGNAIEQLVKKIHARVIELGVSSITYSEIILLAEEIGKEML